MYLINYVLLIIPVLICIAFVTLLERKILGYSQLRKGPNKVSIIGVMQPFNDAVKLFSNESLFPFSINIKMFIFAPVLALMITLSVFMMVPMKEQSFSISFGLVAVYMMLSLNIYPTLLSGWASNSKYALIGALRSVAQTVSYEVSLALIFLFYFMLTSSFSLTLSSSLNSLWMKEFIFMPLMGIWLISCLAETNRTPFDFAEGESELVSGFNIEYGSVGFAVIFMAEYGSILFMSFFFSYMFFASSSLSVTLYLVTGAVVFFWVWARTTFPRYRYDKLMALTWKLFLPMSLAMCLYSLSMPILKSCQTSSF